MGAVSYGTRGVVEGRSLGELDGDVAERFTNFEDFGAVDIDWVLFRLCLFPVRFLLNQYQMPHFECIKTFKGLSGAYGKLLTYREGSLGYVACGEICRDLSSVKFIL